MPGEKDYTVGKWSIIRVPHSVFPHVMVNECRYTPGINDPLAYQYPYNDPLLRMQKAIEDFQNAPNKAVDINSLSEAEFVSKYAGA